MPRIIGDSVNLHPIIFICAVAVGLTVGGILGALLAPPVVASFRVIGGYVHAKLLDYPPFRDRAGSGGVPRTYRRKVSGRELDERRSQAKGAAGDKQPVAPEQKSTTGAGVSSEANGAAVHQIPPASNAHIDAKRVLADQES